MLTAFMDGVPRTFRIDPGDHIICLGHRERPRCRDGGLLIPME